MNWLIIIIAFALFGFACFLLFLVGVALIVYFLASERHERMEQLAAKQRADAKAKGKTDIEWGVFRESVMTQIDEMFRDPKEQA